MLALLLIWDQRASHLHEMYSINTEIRNRRNSTDIAVRQDQPEERWARSVCVCVAQTAGTWERGIVFDRTCVCLLLCLILM